MKKSFCDKCQKDCTFFEREIKCNGHYLWLDTSNSTNIGKDLLLCFDCKIELEKIIFNWIYSKLPDNK